jgi:hypothetical protein
MRKEKRPLKDYKVNIRIVLSAFWTATMFCYLYGDYFELYVPNKVAGLLSGDNLLDSPMKLFVTTLVMAVPALMVLLTLVVSARWAKGLNIGVGVFFTLFTLLVGMASMSSWRTFYVFLSFLESLLTAMIVYKAWHWPRNEASE